MTFTFIVYSTVLSIRNQLMFKMPIVVADASVTLILQYSNLTNNIILLKLVTENCWQMNTFENSDFFLCLVHQGSVHYLIIYGRGGGSAKSMDEK